MTPGASSKSVSITSRVKSSASWTTSRDKRVQEAGTRVGRQGYWTHKPRAGAREILRHVSRCSPAQDDEFRMASQMKNPVLSTPLGLHANRDGLRSAAFSRYASNPSSSRLDQTSAWW